MRVSAVHARRGFRGLGGWVVASIGRGQGRGGVLGRQQQQQQQGRGHRRAAGNNPAFLSTSRICRYQAKQRPRIETARAQGGAPSPTPLTLCGDSPRNVRTNAGRRHQFQPVGISVTLSANSDPGSRHTADMLHPVEGHANLEKAGTCVEVSKDEDFIAVLQVSTMSPAPATNDAAQNLPCAGRAC